MMVFLDIFGNVFRARARTSGLCIAETSRFRSSHVLLLGDCEDTAEMLRELTNKGAR